MTCGIDQMTCPDLMMEAYRSAFGHRKNIPSAFSQSNEFRARIPKPVSELCPFTLAPNSSCVLNEIQRVLAFLVHDSNWTNAEAETSFSKVGYSPIRFPKLQYGPISSQYYPIDIPSTGGAYSVHFITSDSVRQEQSLLSTFVNPLDAYVWLALGVATNPVALCMAPFGKQGFGLAVSSKVLDFASSLFDQFAISSKQME